MKLTKVSTCLSDAAEVSLVPEPNTKTKLVSIPGAREAVAKNGRIKGVDHIDLKPSQ